MFKKLMNLVLDVRTEADFWDARSEIDKTYQNGKLSVKDRELLEKLIRRVFCEDGTACLRADAFKD